MTGGRMPPVIDGGLNNRLKFSRRLADMALTGRGEAAIASARGYGHGPTRYGRRRRNAKPEMVVRTGRGRAGREFGLRPALRPLLRAAARTLRQRLLRPGGAAGLLRRQRLLRPGRGRLRRPGGPRRPLLPLSLVLARVTEIRVSHDDLQLTDAGAEPHAW